MDALAELIGNSPEIVSVRQRLAALLGRKSRRLPSILLEGETGTGKGLLARCIHRASLPSTAPFIEVNCAAIPATLLEAELFGVDRGAFTDARHSKPGLFQAAHRGTLFLDEVALLGQELQAKLLKAVEDRAVRRLGSTHSEQVDISIIAATNGDLAGAVRHARFRADLYHRLAVVRVTLPPLRQRLSDLPALAEHLLTRICDEHGLPLKTLDAEACDLLMRYPWPGNIRELGNVLERAALFSDSFVLTRDLLELPRAEPLGASKGHITERGESSDADAKRVAKALVDAEWNVARAAQRLMLSRNALRYRIEKYGLTPPFTPQRGRPRADGQPRSTPVRDTAAPREGSHKRVPSTSLRSHRLPQPLYWDRRHLTVFRLALAGREPGWLPGRVLESALEKVTTFGGRVQEFEPGGVIAVFGLEYPEDAARRAAHAGEAIQRLGAAADVSTTIALHTAQLLVTQAEGWTGFSPDEKREAWRIAERLIDAAEPGTIVASRETAAFLERTFALTPLAHESNEITSAFTLRRRVQADPSSHASQFVGRLVELSLLRNRFQASLGDCGQVVTIVGDAGIGKSRLLFEFRRSLQGQPVTYLEASCPSHGAMTPYLPVLELVRLACRIVETDDLATYHRKLLTTLADVGMDVAESAPYLLHLLGIGTEAPGFGMLVPETIQRRTIDVLIDLFARMSRRQVTILVIEDVHWADQTSQHVLIALRDGLRSARILMLLTSRHPAAPAETSTADTTTLVLEPLSRADSLSVVRSIIGDNRSREMLAEVIASKAEGNPFFIEELGRAVTGSEDGLRAIPPTIKGVLLARIDQLPHDSRRILKVASVLGQELSGDLLRRVYEHEMSDSSLNELVRRGFLVESPATGENVYRFKHALTQEVMYDTLSLPERQRLHSRAADALATLHADRLHDVVELLAHHHQNGMRQDQAITYTILANQKAANANAMPEAKAHFDVAMGLLQPLSDPAARRRRVELLVNQGKVFLLLFSLPEYHDLLSRHQEEALELGDPALLGRFYTWLSHCQWWFGDFERSLQTAAEGARLSTIAGDAEEAAHAHTEAAWDNLNLGRLEDVLRDRDRCVEALAQHFNLQWHVYVHSAAAWAGAHLGRWFSAEADAHEALRRAREFGDRSMISFACWTLSVVCTERLVLAQAIKYGEMAVDYAPTPADRAWAQTCLAFAWCRADRPREATEVLAGLVTMYRDGRFLPGEFATVYLAESYWRAGDHERAECTLREVIDVTERHAMQFIAASARRLLAEVLLTLPSAGTVHDAARLTEAQSHLNSARQTLAALGAGVEFAAACAASGRASELENKAAEARTWYSRALEHFNSLSMPAEGARIQGMLDLLNSKNKIG